MLHLLKTEWLKVKSYTSYEHIKANAIYRTKSSLDLYTKNSPPVLLYYGANDQRTPYKRQNIYIEKAVLKGVRVTVKSFDGLDHMLTSDDYNIGDETALKFIAKQIADEFEKIGN